MKQVQQGAYACSFVLLLLLFWLVRAEGGETAAQRRKARSARAVSVTDLFNTNCARCHGADGRGDTPLGHLFKTPDFTDEGWWKKNLAITNTRSLTGIVIRGKAGMPGFGKKLTRREISLLVNRVRRFRRSS